MNPDLQLPPHILRRIALCERCSLWRTRKNPVPGRGIAPASVLFVGEGPGKSEDMRGLAFIGPTRTILDPAIVTAAEWVCVETPSCFFTNLVCCRPCDSRVGPNRPPSGEEAWACYQNLKLIVEAVAPKLIVLMGQVTTTFASAPFPNARNIPHPAYILRVGGVGSPAYLSFVKSLSVAFKATFGLAGSNVDKSPGGVSAGKSLTRRPLDISKDKNEDQT